MTAVGTSHKSVTLVSEKKCVGSVYTIKLAQKA